MPERGKVEIARPKVGVRSPGLVGGVETAFVHEPYRHNLNFAERRKQGQARRAGADR